MTLTGALPGIQYLFKPDINKIFTKKCWQDAATQTFFNLGLGIFQFYDSYIMMKKFLLKIIFYHIRKLILKSLWHGHILFFIQSSKK